MNITYIIGNGFDINIGLKTSYQSFYPFFEKCSSEDNLILCWLSEDKENGDIEKWSDLEKRIGEKTELLNDSEFETFEDDLMELCDLLRAYLKLQEEKLIYDRNENYIYQIMSSSITSFLDNGNPSQKEVIKKQQIIMGIKSLIIIL